MEQALPTQIELQVVTPERPVVSETVVSVSLPGKDGRLGILPGHAPLVSELAAGVVFFEHSGRTQYLAVSSGFTEVLQRKVTVLVQTAERAEDINVERAREAKRQAEEKLKTSGDSAEDLAAAQEALDRAKARIEAAEQHHA